MLRRLLIALALVLAPIGVGTAAAHQQKIAISTVSLNPRTKAIEIVHQVPVHDAEHALRRQGTNNPDIIGSEASREAFARYVARRFLLVVDGQIVIPDYVGSEITGGSLWVYQETAAPGATVRIRVNSQILTDVWARQENRVNLGGGTKVETFVFNAGDTPREADLVD
jgi:hypothetical protein